MWFLIGTSLLVIFIFNRIYSYVTYWRHIKKIPGPPSIPFYGNGFKGLSSPQDLFNKQRELANIFKDIYAIYGPTMAVVFLYNADDIEQVLTNSVHNTKSAIYNVFHSWLGTGLLTSTGTKWQIRRKMITAAFHFNVLREFVNIFNTETQHLVEALEKRSTEPYIDVVPEITELALHSIAETSLGVSLKESQFNETYKNAVHEFGKIFARRLSRIWLIIPFIYYFTPTRKQEEKIVKVLHEASNSVIEQRKRELKLAAKNQNDSSKKRLALLDLLLKAREEGTAKIDDEGIREEVDTFMFAGHDTISTAVCYALMILANHKDIQEKILQEINEVLENDQQKLPNYNEYQEMKYLERCIKESLRLFPSVHMIARLAGEDFTTKSGYFIPKGTMINMSFYDLHRRADTFEDPGKFDPDRFLPENSEKRHPFAYVPFSAGFRNCIGQRYAILEIKAVLCGIIRNFILEPIDTPATITIKPDIVLRSGDGIKIKFVPRN